MSIVIDCYYGGRLPNNSEEYVIIHADFIKKIINEADDIAMYRIHKIHKVIYGQVVVEDVEGLHIANDDFRVGARGSFEAARDHLEIMLTNLGMKHYALSTQYFDKAAKVRGLGVILHEE